MKTVRPVLTALLCLLICLALLPARAYADAPGDEQYEIMVEQAPERYVPGGGGDNGALLDAYVQQRLDSLLPMQPAYIRNVGNDLPGVNRTVYTTLKSQISAVAAGTESSTVIEIPVSGLGLTKTSWTASELGLSTLVENGTFSDEAMAAVNARVGFSLREVVSALLADCPYELYWYDKTVGTSYKPYGFGGTSQSIGIVGNMIFTFAVSTEYDDGTYVEIRNPDGTMTRDYCAVDSSLITGIGDALATAAQIVADYAASSDYEKLVGYRNEICKRVKYNNAAASGGVAYGNPWQIIWVFDEDDTDVDNVTNVVCEGYAKAFQYLCDLTQFSGSVSAWTVTGTMGGGTGAGSHMWNIVRMDNGINYLVDLTNCDSGAVGSPDKLFLAGHSGGSLNNGYVFTPNNIPVTYTYESKMRAIFPDSDLRISGASYLEDTSVPAAGTVLTMAHLEQAITDFINSGASSVTVRFTGSGNFIVDRNITIPLGMNFYLPNGTLLVDEGVTMTVALGGTVTAEHANIQGTLYVLGTFATDSASSTLTVSGRLDNRGSVVVLDPNFQRTANMKTNGGRYYVEHFASDEAAIRSACTIAAGDSDAAVTHEILPQAQIALTQDLTVPANVRMRIASGSSLSYVSGVTLTLNGRIETRANFVGLGTTVNNGQLSIMRSATAQFGDYEGSGVLKVYSTPSNPDDDPFDHITGLDPQYFSCTLGADNYWALSLVRYTVRFLNYDDTVLQTLSVPHGTVPVYTGETPARASDAQYFYTFTGWDPVPAAASASADYTAQFSATLIAVVDSGSCGAQGSNVTYTLYNDGRLVISGTGDMADYSSLSAPWSGSASDIVAVTVESGVTGIGGGAFANCGNLTAVSLPEGLTGIGENAFDNCGSLAAVSFGGSQQQRGAREGAGWSTVGNSDLFSAVWTCAGLLPDYDGVLPSALTEIGEEAMAGCAFEAVYIPSGVTEIGTRAFAGSPNLAYVYIPASVTSIASDAFWQVTGLTVIGQAGSEAEDFADAQGFAFIEG